MFIFTVIHHLILFVSLISATSLDTRRITPSALASGDIEERSAANLAISPASTIVVTNTDDSGSGTLRQSIIDANSHPGADTIAFNIPGPGSFVITTGSALPTITDPVTIDGSTQPGFNGSPIIELNGSQSGADVDGLRITAGNSVVTGLVINRFGGDGLEMTNNGGNLVEGCYIGTDAAGTVDLGNAFHGLNIQSSNNLIGGTAPVARNVISGNNGAGIFITAGTTGNVIQGNFIGTDAAGATAIGNSSSGVLTVGQSGNFASHTIGGTTPGARNIISGNLGSGITIGGTLTGHLVQGNFIGTDVTGRVAVGNTSDGVLIIFGSANNTIGGTTPEARNVISGNGGNGVRSDYHPNTVQGNFIGTQVDGNNPLGNGSNGVLINFTIDNSIGGTASGAGNTIAFNGGVGVLVVGTSNTVSSNAVFANASIGIDLGGDGVTQNDPCDVDSGDNMRQNSPVITSSSNSGGSTTIQGTLDSAPNSTFRIEIFSSSASDPSGFGEGEKFIGSAIVTTDGGCHASFSITLPTVIPPGSFITATATDQQGNTSEFARSSLLGGGSTTPTAFDFDGDGKSDLSIFRPMLGQWWYFKSSTGGTGAAQFGLETDKITPADFTGDGKTDVAVFRPSTGEWYVLRSEDSSFYAVRFGTSDDIPVPADYDGDGMADVAVFRPSTATWYINNSSGGVTAQRFGVSSDLPVPADYDGDGKADTAIYRQGASEWWIKRSTAGVIAHQFGTTDDKTVQGDYTGDGKADVAVWRPSTGVWFILRSEDRTIFAFHWGTSGDLPSPGDYDGDGKIDPSVFRPSDSTWYVNRSTTGILFQQFGQPGDLSVPNSFVR